MRKRSHRPPLTVKQIVAWAKAHQQRTGYRPHAYTGAIPGTQETWLGVDSALRKGHRGFPGGSSLSRLLDKHCAKTFGKVQLTVKQILSWMKRHRRRTGQWPVAASGEVIDAPGENWRSLDSALRFGNRGLPAGLSLWRLRLLQDEQTRQR
ncbi:MAG TPA: hypothetical protein VH643_20230 [Gemmataceae bacterium]|jgi:hypothetical protein